MGAFPTVVRAHGPIALEAELAAAARAESAAIRADPSRLASPIAIAVPSDALRVHVTALLARELGALVGLRVQSLANLAHEVLALCDAPPIRGALAARILVQRAARSALREHGEDFAPAAEASITDLLDAGLVPELAGAVLEAAFESNAAGAASPLERKVAESVVRAATHARSECTQLDVARAADVYARAAAAVRDAPFAGGPRGVMFYGFSDATGLQADWMEALAAVRPATIFWDDAANAPRFGAALRARFGIEASERDAESSGAPPPAHFRARGAEAEVREALCRTRVLIDAGVVPERIGIVARDPGPYRAALRTHAARLGIPLSAEGALGPLTARGRMDMARLDILRDARRVPTDRWLAARVDAGNDRLALLIGLRVLGAARLGAVAELDLQAVLGDRDSLLLPLQVARTPDEGTAHESEEPRDEGFDEGEASGDDETADEPGPESSRVLPRSVLEAAIASARALLGELDAWPPKAGFDQHMRHLARVSRRLDSDRRAADQDDRNLRAAEQLAREVPAEFALTRLEFVDALAPAVEARAHAALGGRGAGVQFASVTFARARAFEHLFVVGLNAGVFPAAAREDPLLGDEVRRSAQACLADLPQKRARTEEESATFAQLLSSAGAVTLSWLVADADDEPRAPSPLLDAAGIVRPEDAPLCGGPTDPRAGVPQPLHEHAGLAAREAGPTGLAEVLELAILDARRANGLPLEGSAAIARARGAVLAEYDRAPGPVESLGPFFGFVGGARPAGRRTGDLHVTTLENVSKCPWQAFLKKVLRIAAPLDPLLGAPRIDARITGTIAHALIADTAPRADVRFEDVLDSEGRAPTWASPQRLHSRALELAARALREAGLFAPGLDALVAARALEVAAVARRLDESEPDMRVVAAEAAAWTELDSRRRLLFRADRVERTQLQLRMTDWKSGRVFTAKRPLAPTRTKHLLNGIRRGTHLQAFVYALVSGEGRYVELRPDEQGDDNRVYSVFGDDNDAQTRFDAARSAALAAWDRGVLFPRLVEPGGAQENSLCKSCEVAAACVRGDSGTRRRFEFFVKRPGAEAAGQGTEELERIARKLFDLHAPEPKPIKAEKHGAETDANAGPDATTAKPVRKPRGKKSVDP